MSWLELLGFFARHLLTGAVILTLPVAAQNPGPIPKDFVWRLKDSAGTLFLAGSLHELRAGDRPSLSLYAAYARSDRVVFEADISEFAQPTFRKEVERLALMPKGQTLSSSLDPITGNRLKVLARRNGLEADTFDRYKPWYAGSYAGLLIVGEAGFQEDHGIDRYFFDRARRERKSLEYLETGRQQLDLLTQIPDSEAVESLRQDLAGGVEYARSMVTAWERGDVEGVDRLTSKDSLSLPISYQRFLIDRNLAWLPRLERWLTQTNCTLVVVGAGHLVGTNGLIHLLANRGHSALQLPETREGSTRNAEARNHLGIRGAP